MNAFYAAYASLAYVVFLASFLYAIGFVGNFWVPKSIDTGSTGSLWAALVVDLLVLGAFAVQHSVMARPAFKRWWTRYVPRPMERSTYVLAASLLLFLVFAAWRPFPAPVWTVESPAGRAVLLTLFGLGWLIVLCSTFMIDHFELFGLKQAFSRRAASEERPAFTTRFLYRFVRHPIMLGFLIAFWATPDMTQGHLLFAATTSAYILVGVALEESDLLRTFGGAYEDYRARVPKFLPLRPPVEPRVEEITTVSHPKAEG